MTESIVATYDNVKFIEGVSKLTQDNWQSYFSHVIQNGVYSGLEFQQQVNTSSIMFHITDGIAFVNGIMAELHTADGYTDIGSWYETGNKDAFYCLRVYLNQEKAEIVKKTDIIDSVTASVPDDFYLYTYALGYFLQDESYQCARNNTYYDIPLMYFGMYATFLRFGRDLRRMVKPDGTREINPKNPCVYANFYNLVRSNNVYAVGTAGTSYYIDSVNLPDDAIIVAGSSSTTIKLYHEHYINDYYASNVPQYPYTDYKNAYVYQRGLQRYEFLFKSGITHTSGSESSGFLNTYESITLGANQTLHITFAYKEVSQYGDKFYFLVE